MNIDMDDFFVDARPVSTGATAKFYKTEKLIQQFTGETRFEEEFSLYTCDDKFIYVPRNFAPIGKQDLRVEGMDCDMPCSASPRNAEQKRIYDEAAALLQRKLSFVIKAGTGVGKSVLGLMLASLVGKTTVVVVHKDDLVDQWYERIRQFLDIPENRIGVIKGDQCDYKGKWIVIASLKSICKEGRYPPAMYRHFGFMICDEVQKFPAEEARKVFHLFPTRIRLGLSATPNRKDGKEVLIFGHIGPIAVSSEHQNMSFKVLKYQTPWECPKRKNDEGDWVNIDHSPSKCGHVINHIAKHKSTNEQAAQWIKQAYDKGRHIIVFSDRIEHLQALMQMSPIPDRDKALYAGAMKKDEVYAAQGKRVLYSTYQKMDTGTDLPWFDTIFFLSPRSDVEQAIGRILRECDDKNEPVVFDFRHDDSHVFKGYGRKRDEFYKRRQAKVVTIK